MVADRGRDSAEPGQGSAGAAVRTGALASLPLRWIAAWSTRRAVLILVAFALVSVIATIVVNRDPGFLIGLFLIIGSVIAALGSRRAVHRLIPVPALTYLVTTTVVGAVHDRTNLSDTKEFATSFLTWIGSAFFALAWATGLVVVIAIVRGIIAWRRGANRPSPASSRGPRPADAPRPAPASGRDAPGATSRSPRAPWHASQDPYGDQAPGGNAFGDTQVVPDAFGRSTRRTRTARDQEPQPGADPRGGRTGRDGRVPRDERSPRDDRGYPRDRDGWDRREQRTERPGRDERSGRMPRDEQDSWDDDRGTRDGRRRDPYPDPRTTRHPRSAEGPRDLW